MRHVIGKLSADHGESQMSDETGSSNAAEISTGGVNPANPIDAINDAGTRRKALPHAVGINHVALSVGDISEALTFYGKLFSIELRGRTDHAAFVDLGDQFIALMETSDAAPRDINNPPATHFGLVVDDLDAFRHRVAEEGIPTLPGPFFDFLDPWGNRIQVVGYSEIQFIKSPAILDAMGVQHLTKSAEALAELREKGVDIPSELIAP
jgi:lactoylglutathione lyase